MFLSFCYTSFHQIHSTFIKILFTLCPCEYKQCFKPIDIHFILESSEMQTFLIFLLFVGTSFACIEHLARTNYGRYGSSSRNRIINATITCTNISSSATIDYRFKNQLYEQFLIVTNSTLTTLGPNELANFSTIGKLFLREIHIKEIQPGAFAGLTTLKELYLDGNELTRVLKGVFNSLQKLEVLDLSSNKIYQIEEWALLGASSLVKLDLRDNNISEFDEDVLDKLKLEYLDLSRNPLEKLSAKHLSNLTTLNLQQTNLSHFEGLDLAVEVLNLSRNRVSQLNLSNFSRLVVLDLSSNNITRVGNCQMCDSISSLVLNQSESLQFLNISVNSIATIENDAFDNLTSLGILDLSQNNITSLNPASFKDLMYLKFLNLSHNSIKEFQYGTFDHLTRLESLDISNNQLVDLHQYTFVSLNQLRQLHFDNNQITSFDVLDLWIRHRYLRNISLNGNPWKCKELVKLNDERIRISGGSTFDKPNYRGIPCTNEKQQTQNLTVESNTSVTIPPYSFSKSINQTAQTSELSRLLNEDFEKSKFAKFFEKEDRSRGILIFIVLLQVIICCLLVFIAYSIFNFVKKNSPKYGTRSSPQLEIMLGDTLN
jgi:Leucine-rich repeat (LRR) protein